MRFKHVSTIFIAALLTFGICYTVDAGNAGFAFLLKGGYIPEDSTCRVTSLSGNTLNRPATTWMIEAFGDTVDATIYGPEGSFTWRFSPGAPGDTTLVGLARLTSAQVPVGIDSVTFDRSSTQAECKFVGAYLK